MRSRFIFFAVLLLALNACSGDKSAKSKGAKADSIPMTTIATPRDSLGRPIGHFKRPETVNMTVNVGGNPQLQAAELLTQPPGFPVAFTTYKSTDMQFGYAGGTRASITLTPVFGAKSDPTAYIQILFDTTSLATSDPAGAALRQITKGRKLSALTTSDIGGRAAWAAGAKSFHFTEAGNRIAGQIVVGRRGRNSFWILTQYPVEYAEQMSRHVTRLIDDWRWEDDYSYLVPAPPAIVKGPGGDTARKTVAKPPAVKRH